jgi:putative tricarboxylic transport membrane protein
VLAAILAPKMEQSLRQATLLSDGDWSVFLTSPISAVFLLLGVAVVAADIVSRRRRSRRLVEVTEDE